jgi:hypothetical protein
MIKVKCLRNTSLNPSTESIKKAKREAESKSRAL